MAEYTATRVAEPSVESSASAVEWGAIFGGAVAAIGVTIILSTLASGMGHSTISPWTFSNHSPATFGKAAAIGLVVLQWLSSALGGYLAGRLRIKWVGIRTDEIFFRDTAHGFLAWAVATVAVAALFGMAAIVAAGSAATGMPAAAPEITDQARKAAESFSLITSLSFVIGAFVASAAAALGGFHRDET
jgi:hypothetical protein